jgi:hypothetical protein
MNPARTFGPDLVGTTFTSYWVYVAGPLADAVLAVGIAFVLRGRSGGDKSAAGPPRATCSPRSTSPASPEDPAMVTGTDGAPDPRSPATPSPARPPGPPSIRPA